MGGLHAAASSGPVGDAHSRDCATLFGMFLRGWLLFLACLPIVACRAMASLHDPNDSFPTADDVPRGTPREEWAAAGEPADALELEQARLEAERLVAAARRELASAERRVVEARQALKAFRSSGRALREEEARLTHDGALRRVDDAEARLAALEAEGADELDLERARLDVEYARRVLAVEERKLGRLLSEELPREERALEGALADAEGELEEAHLGVEIAEVEGRAGIRRAEAAVER